MKKKGLVFLLAAVLTFSNAAAVLAGAEVGPNVRQEEQKTAQDEVYEELITVDDAVPSIHEGDLISVPMDNGTAVLAAEGWEDTLRTRLKAAMDKMELKVDVRDLNIDRNNDITALKNVLYLVLNGNDKYFYLKSSVSWSYSPSTNQIFTLTLRYQDEYMSENAVDTAKIKKDLQILEEGKKRALAALKPEMSEPEVVLALHDFMVQEVDYDMENYNAGSIPWYSYNALGIYREGKAVCNGYAIAFGSLLAELGFPTYVVTSDSMNHAWNMVYVEDSWYHVDVTWDDPVFSNGTTYLGRANNDLADEGYVSHQYLLKSDSEMLKLNHKDWYVQHTEGVEIPVADTAGYPNAAYQGVKGSMNYIDGYWYYAPIGYNGNTVYRTKFDGSGKTSFCTGNSIRYLQAKDGVLYFCNLDGVYSVNPDGTDEKVRADYRRDSAEVTEISVKKGEVYYVTADASDSSNVKFTHVMLDTKPETELPFEITEIKRVMYNAYRITWNAKKGADGYVLYGANAPKGPWKVMRSNAGNGNTNYAKTFDENKDWYFKVRPYVLENGAKVFGEETESVKAPALPGSTEFTLADMFGSNTVELNWSEAAHADGYLIYEKAENAQEFQLAKKISGGSTVRYIKKVVPGKKYYYKIKAFVEIENGRRLYGAESETVQGFVLSGPPQILNTEKYGGNKEKITWSSIEGADGYALYYSDEENGSYKLYSVSKSGDTVSLVRTSDGSGYYKIRAYRLINGIRRCTELSDSYGAYDQR